VPQLGRRPLGALQPRHFTFQSRAFLSGNAAKGTSNSPYAPTAIESLRDAVVGKRRALIFPTGLTDHPSGSARSRRRISNNVARLMVAAFPLYASFERADDSSHPPFTSVESLGFALLDPVLGVHILLVLFSRCFLRGRSLSDGRACGRRIQRTK
jgi:hypothetical protein